MLASSVTLLCKCGEKKGGKGVNTYPFPTILNPSSVEEGGVDGLDSSSNIGGGANAAPLSTIEGKRVEYTYSGSHPLFDMQVISKKSWIRCISGILPITQAKTLTLPMHIWPTESVAA